MTEPRGPLRRLLELLGLSALAITQPVLAAFGDGAEEFIFRGISALGIVAFALFISLVPALLVWCVEESLRSRIGSRSENAGATAVAMVHLSVVFVLAAATVTQIVKGATGWPAGVLIALGLIGGAAVAFARWREPITSLVFAILSLFALLAVGTFLFASPASDILFDDGTANAARVDMGSPAPVVLIVLDELPTLSLINDEGAIDPDRWPNFATLAAESNWFRNHTGVAPSTPTAVPAILSGRFPTDIDALPVVDQHPQNLFTMLAGTHDLRVHESVTRICPQNVCGADDGAGGSYVSLLTDAFDIVVERTKPSRTVEAGVDFNVPQSDPAADRKIGEWLDRLVPTESPHLDVIHTVLPHQPWWRLPSGQVYGGNGEGAPVVANGLDPVEYSWIGSFVAESARTRHLLQTGFADDQLGVMLDRMRANGTYDESLVIVTADHGVAFNLDEPIRGLSTGNETEVMWVPLFMKLPGQVAGEVFDTPASSVDIVPTIADVLDFDLPWEVDGRSVFDPAPEGPDIRFFADWFLNLRETTDGVLVEVDGQAGFERLLEATPPEPVDPADPWGFYRFGDLASLLGQPVSDFPTETIDLTAQLNEFDRYLDVDPAAVTLPAYIHGTAPLRGGDRVVVAINGVIAGWSEIVGTRDGAGWFTVVPPTAFSLGNNTVELYKVEIEDQLDVDDSALSDNIVLRQLALTP